jgi:PII-like signaling protein
VDEDCLRLTGYFRERQPAGRGLRLLTALYASRDVTASIVLRGSKGSVMAVAVGTAPDVEALLGDATRLTRPGLLTVEHARLLTGDIDPVWLGEEPGEATRLTVHSGRDDHAYLVPAFEAACELLYRRGIAGATVLPGIDGTAHGGRQRHRYLSHDAGAPLMVIAVGSGNEIGMVLPELATLFRHPVMTLEKVRVCKRDGQLVSLPQALPVGGRPEMAARLRLTAYTSEAARHDGQPLHRAIARQLGAAGITGVTALHGIWGFHGDHAPHGDHFPHLSRHVPVVTTVTGTPERISTAFGIIDALTTERGLVTAETVLAVQPAADGVQR